RRPMRTAAASLENRLRDPAPSVYTDGCANHANHEGGHRSNRRADPPADRAAEARSEQGEELGHGLWKDHGGTFARSSSNQLTTTAIRGRSCAAASLVIRNRSPSRDTS